MPLEIVTGMPLQPSCCTLCGGNPIDESTGEQIKAIYASGVDIDWGNSVYICWECGHLIADLVGRSTKEGFDKLLEENDEWREKYEKLLELYEADQALVAKIREGSSAIKQVREKELA